MRKVLLVALLGLLSVNAIADMVVVDVSPKLVVWFFHIQDYGYLKQEVQAYTSIDEKWFTLATGPVIHISTPAIKVIRILIPAVEGDLKTPVGLRVDASDPNLPISHWVGKINFGGKVGPFSVTAIHELCYGRKDNPYVLFIKEIVDYKGVGLRSDMVKVEGKPFNQWLGPMLSHKVGESTIQFFFGLNVRKAKEKALKVSYSYKF